MILTIKSNRWQKSLEKQWSKILDWLTMSLLTCVFYVDVTMHQRFKVLDLSRLINLLSSLDQLKTLLTIVKKKMKTLKNLNLCFQKNKISLMKKLDNFSKNHKSPMILNWSGKKILIKRLWEIFLSSKNNLLSLVLMVQSKKLKQIKEFNQDLRHFSVSQQ